MTSFHFPCCSIILNIWHRTDLMLIISIIVFFTSGLFWLFPVSCYCKQYCKGHLLLLDSFLRIKSQKSYYWVKQHYHLSDSWYIYIFPINFLKDQWAKRTWNLGILKIIQSIICKMDTTTNNNNDDKKQNGDNNDNNMPIWLNYIK